MKKFHRGEIWMIDLDATIGHEQAKKRPCLIISSDNMNSSPAQLIFAVPITSKRKNLSFHIQINPPEGGLELTSYIMCEQTRSLSINRITKYMGTVDEVTLLKIENILKILLDF